MPTPQVRDAVDVHVDADAFVSPPGRAHAEVGHLGSHAREGGQAFDRGGDVGGVVGAQDFGRGFDVAGFVVL